jgi:hypothetical protein
MTNITTARDLLAAIRHYTPAVEGGELVLGSDPPAELEPLIEVLQTGIRACLTGRLLWGSSNWSAVHPRVERLNPGEPLPGWVGLLAAEGDSSWDRIGPAAKLDYPGLSTGTLGRSPSLVTC